MRRLRRTPTIVLSGLFALTITASTPMLFAERGESTSSTPHADADAMAAARYDSEFDRASRSQASVPLPFEDVTTTTTSVVETTTVPPTTSAPEPETVKAAAAPATTTPKRSTSAPATTAAPPAVSASTKSSVNDYLLRALNGERSARGLSPLVVDATLTKKAQDWSAQMAQNGAMSHSGSGIPAGFNAYGENVLKASSGTTAGTMHNTWLASAGHRKQMLQPGFDRVGIGAVCLNGAVYATETFGHAEAAGEANLSSDVPDATPQAPVSGGPTC